MAILSGDLIRQLVRTNKLVIEPFNDDAVEPASYDLRLGKRALISPKGDERGRAADLDKEPNQKLIIHPGQYVAILTEERLGLPSDICARFGLKSNLARKGLMSFGGIQVDPGFRGRLAISLFNVGPENIEIVVGSPTFTIEFERLDAPTSKPYSGQYQDQDDFPAEQYNFILRAHTVSLAEIPDLREQVKQLNNRLSIVDVLREDIEELLGDPDRDLEINDTVRERLRRCLSMGGRLAETRDAGDVAKKLGLVW
jgi:dCTP deaminase